MTKPFAAHSRKNEPWAKARAWRSPFAPLAELPGESRGAFERTGY